MSIGGGEDLGRAVLTIDTDQDPYNQSLDAAERNTNAWGNRIKGVFKGLAVFDLAVNGVRRIADAIGGLIDPAAKFEDAMNNVFTQLPGLSQSAFEKMKGDVKNFAVEVKRTTSDVIPALYDAVSAGVPADNVFDFLRVASKNATGGFTTLATSTDALTTVVNSYGAANISAAHASDIMFTTVRLGKLTMEELAGSLHDVVPVANGVGLSFDQVGAAVAAMTGQGIPAATAATNLQQVLVQLQQEGSKTATVFEKVSGKSFRDFIRGGGTLQQALQLLEEHANKTGVGINTLFGRVQAGQAALALTGQGTEAFNHALQAMQDSAGATDDAYAKMNRGINATLRQLRAQFDIIKIQLSEKIAPAFAAVGDAISNGIIPAVTSLASFLDRILGGPLRALAHLIAVPVVGAFVLFRDAAITLREALRGNWADDRQIRPLHRIVGETGLLIRNVLIPAISGVAGVIGRVLGPPLRLALDLFGRIRPIVADFLTIFGSLGGAIATIGGIGTALTLLGALAAPVLAGLAAAIGTISLPLVAISAALTALYLAWQHNFLGIQQVTGRAMGVVETAFARVRRVGQALFTILGGAWSGSLFEMVRGFGQLPPILIPVARYLATLVGIAGDVARAFGRNGISGAIRTLVADLPTLGRALLSFWGSIGRLALQAFQMIPFRELGRAVLDGLQRGVDLAGMLLGYLRDQIAAVDWGQVGDDLLTGLGVAFGLLDRALDRAIDLAGELLDWLGREIGSVDWARLGRQAIDALWGALTTALSGAGNLATDIFGWVDREVQSIAWTATGRTVLSGIRGALTAAIGAAVDVGQDLYGWIDGQVSQIDWTATGSTILGALETALATAASTAAAVGTTIFDWVRNGIAAVAWKDDATAILESLTTAIQTAIAKAATLGGLLHDWTMDAIDAVQWRDVGQSILDHITSAIQTIKAGAQSLGGAVVSAVQQALPNTTRPVGPGEGIAGPATPAARAPGPRGPLAPVSGALGATGSAVSAALGPLQTLAGFIGDKVLPLFQKLADFVSSRVTPTIDTWRASLSESADILSTRLGPTLDKFRGLIEAVTPIIDAMKVAGLALLRESIGPLEMAARATLIPFAALGALLGGALLTAIASVGAVLNVAANTIGKVLPDALNLAIDAINIGLDWLTLLADTIVGIGRIVLDLIHGDWSQAWQDAKATVSTLLGDITTLLSDYIEAGKHYVQLIVDGIVGVFDGMYTSIVGENGPIGKTINGITDAFRNLATSIVTVGSDIIAGLVSGITSGFQGLQTIMGEVSGAITGFIGDGKKVLYQLGSDILNGLVDGMNAVKDTVGETAKSIIGGIPIIGGKIVKAQSPSRVMAELGQNIMQGVAVGMTEEQSNTTKAAADAMSAVVKAIQDVIGLTKSLDTLDPGVVERVLGKTSLIGSLKDFGEQLVAKLAEMVPVYSKDVLDGVQQAGQAIQGAVSAFSGVFKLLQDFSQQNFDDLKLPPDWFIGAAKLLGEQMVVKLAEMVPVYNDDLLTEVQTVSQTIQTAVSAISSLFKLLQDFSQQNFNQLILPPDWFVGTAVSLARQIINELGVASTFYDGDVLAAVNDFSQTIQGSVAAISSLFKLLQDISAQNFNRLVLPPDWFIGAAVGLARQILDQLAAALPFYGQDITDGVNRLSAAIQASVGAVSALFGFLQDVSAQNFNRLVLPPDWFVGAAIGLANQIIDQINLAVPIYDVDVTDGVTRLSSAIQAGISAISDVFGLLQDLSKQNFNKLVLPPDWFIGAAIGLGRQILDALAAAVPLFEDDILDGITALANAMSTAVGLAGDLLDLMQQLTGLDARNIQIDPALFRVLPRIGASILRGILSTVPLFENDILDNAVELANAMSAVLDPIEKVLDFLTDLRTALSAGVVRVVPAKFLSILLGLAESVTRAFALAAQQMGGPALDAATAYADAVGPVLDVLSKTSDALTSVQTVPQLSARTLQRYSASVRAALQTVVDLSGDFQKQRGVLGSVQQALSTLGQILGTRLETQGETSGGGLIEGLANSAKGVTDAVQTLKTAVVRGFDGADTLLTDIGAQIITGLITGLQAMQDQLDAAVTAIAQSIPATISTTLDIHSPSRVMQTLGELTGTGFNLGLRAQLGPIAASAAELARTAIPAIGTRSSAPDLAPAGAGPDVLRQVEALLAKQPARYVHATLEMDRKQFGAVVIDTVNNKITRAHR